MEIIGNGFLARHLRPMATEHPGAVALAAGISWAANTSAADFAREADLLQLVAEDCRRKGRRLMFFSSASSGVYGASSGPAAEDDPVAPGTPYGRHKIGLEERLKDSGAAFVILRMSHLVGAGQPPHQLIPTLVRQLREGSVTIHRGATRDLIDVADVVAIIRAVLDRELEGVTVNVASGHDVPVTAIVDHLETRLGVTSRRELKDLGSRHTVSTRKLRALVPEVAGLGFGPHYYRRVLDDFVDRRERR